MTVLKANHPSRQVAKSNKQLHVFVIILNEGITGLF